MKTRKQKNRELTKKYRRAKAQRKNKQFNWWLKHGKKEENAEDNNEVV